MPSDSATENDGSKDANAQRSPIHVWGPVALGLLVLAGAALVRFEHIAAIGMWEWGDAAEYVYNAAHFPTTGDPPYLRCQPAAHAVHALFMAVVGDNDYALKVAGVTFDMANCLLLLLIIWRFSGNGWLACSVLALYAFTPRVIYFARTELPHALAAFWGLVLLVLIARLLIETRVRWRWALLAGGGLAAMAAVLTHLSMLFILPGCAAGVAVSAWRFSSRDTVRGKVVGIIKEGAVFGVVAVAGAAALLLLYPFGELRDYAASVLFRFTSPEAVTVWKSEPQMQMDAIGYSFNALEAAFLFCTVGIRWLATHAFEAEGQLPHGLSAADLLLPLFAVAFYLAQLRKRHEFSLGHLAVLLVFCFIGGISYTTGTFRLANSRYLINIYPIVLVGVFWWLHRAGNLYLRRHWAPYAIVAVALLLSAGQGRLYPFDPALSKPLNVGKEIYLEVGDKVDEDHKLLILPFNVSNVAEAWIQHRHLFGKNAIHVRDIPYSGESLADATRALDIKYVYLSKYVDGWDHWLGTRGGKYEIPLPDVDVYGRPAFKKRVTYLDRDVMDEELERIVAFLEERDGQPVATVATGTVYVLRN